MEIVNYNQQNCDFRFDPACYVPCVSLETWREDYDHRACTYLAKAATLKKTKLYQKMQANNMAYSRISLNHMQQKTDLLTIAVIRKRRRWTANMAAAWIVSSGEQLCCCFLPFFICFSGQGKIPWDFLSAILCHKYHSNHSNRIMSSE